MEMQAEIRSNYDLAAAGIPGSTVAPVGDAFGVAGYSAELYEADLSHPSRWGSRLAAMVIYRAIYGEHVGDIPRVAQTRLTDEQWAITRAWADAVTIVPEPGAAALIAKTLLGVFGVRRRV